MSQCEVLTNKKCNTTLVTLNHGQAVISLIEQRTKILYYRQVEQISTAHYYGNE